MRVWRLVDREFAADAWSGAGARTFGGRWNEPGVAVVYCSEQAALAIVEKFAGGLKPADLRYWVLLSADIPDDAMTDLPGTGTERERAAKWLASGGLACRVPSRVVDGNNVLLNPASPRWKEVRLRGASAMDPRLWGP